MTSLRANPTVYLAVAGAVNRAMGGAIDGGRAVRDAVYVAMGQAVNVAVHVAVSRREEPPPRVGGLLGGGGLMKNQAVDGAVYRAVSLAVYRSAGEGVSWAAYEAVYQTVYRAEHHAVHLAHTQLEEPLQPGLGDLLGGGVLCEIWMRDKK